MNFVVKSVAQGSNARVGRLTFERVCIPRKRKHDDQHTPTTITSNGDEQGDVLAAAYDTPMCFHYTRNGTIPHITWELTQRLDDAYLPVLIPLPNIISIREQIKSSNQSLSSFANIDKRRPTMSIMQDPLEPIRSGHNNIAGVRW